MLAAISDIPQEHPAGFSLQLLISAGSAIQPQCRQPPAREQDLGLTSGQFSCRKIEACRCTSPGQLGKPKEGQAAEACVEGKNNTQ